MDKLTQAAIMKWGLILLGGGGLGYGADYRMTTHTDRVTTSFEVQVKEDLVQVKEELTEAHQERTLLQRDVENIQTNISEKLKNIQETMRFLREHTMATEVELRRYEKFNCGHLP